MLTVSSTDTIWESAPMRWSNSCTNSSSEVGIKVACVLILVLKTVVFC